jgi:hypothetical protein
MPAFPSSKKLSLALTQELQVASTLRTIQVYESAFDANKLQQNKWTFVIAKCVADGVGTPGRFNVIWQSKGIAPNILIEWKDVYGLNWTANVPDPGASITLGGNWQYCGLGQVYDLNETGFWSASSAAGDSRFMNVGKVNYKYPGSDGVHIVIGIQNSDGGFDTIYVDPTALSIGDSAKYQPQEVVEWWYETGAKSATMISSASTEIGSVDLSQPAPTTNKYFYSTTYKYEAGKWVTSADTPSTTLFDPPLDQQTLQSAPPQLFTLWSSIWQGVLSIVVGKDKQASASASLKGLLDIRYNDVQVKFIDDLNIHIELGTPKRAAPNSVDAVGALDENTKGEISDCLQFIEDAKLLPDGETWTITKILEY